MTNFRIYIPHICLLLSMICFASACLSFFHYYTLKHDFDAYSVANVKLKQDLSAPALAIPLSQKHYFSNDYLEYIFDWVCYISEPDHASFQIQASEISLAADARSDQDLLTMANIWNRRLPRPFFAKSFYLKKSSSDTIHMDYTVDVQKIDYSIKKTPMEKITFSLPVSIMNKPTDALRLKSYIISDNGKFRATIGTKIINESDKEFLIKDKKITLSIE